LQEARLRREQAQSLRADRQPASVPMPSAPAPAPSPAAPPRFAESFSAESAASAASVGSVGSVGSVPSAPSAASPPQTARNAPCPCKSGLKFKRCCGKSAPPRLHQKAVA
jgi:preprotein translocase subunit SecA